MRGISLDKPHSRPTDPHRRGFLCGWKSPGRIVQAKRPVPIRRVRLLPKPSTASRGGTRGIYRCEYRNLGALRWEWHQAPPFPSRTGSPASQYSPVPVTARMTFPIPYSGRGTFCSHWIRVTSRNWACPPRDRAECRFLAITEWRPAGSPRGTMVQGVTESAELSASDSTVLGTCRAYGAARHRGVSDIALDRCRPRWRTDRSHLFRCAPARLDQVVGAVRSSTAAACLRILLIWT